MTDNLKHGEEMHCVAASNEMLSRKLYDVLRDEEKNLIMSPFSVSCVMAMVSVGARENTLQQIQSGFNFPSPSSLQLGYEDTIPVLRTSDNNFVLEMANTVFATKLKESSVIAQFQEILTRSFHANIQIVDSGDRYGAAMIINSWVEKMTRDKINNLISVNMLNKDTSLVLVNAIYFKGEWAEKFDSNQTVEQDFSINPFLTMKVPMMRQRRNILWAYVESLASTMVELPYKGHRIVMHVLLPGERDGLGELEEKLTNHNVHDLFEKASYKTDVMIQLPKFKLEQTIRLEEYLNIMGMKDMFTYGVADFSGVDGTMELFVSTVVQKAFIEVNEEGSEAAAATAMLMCDGGSTEPPPKQFVADHPFIFYLKDKTTGMLLFQGRVVNPV